MWGCHIEKCLMINAQDDNRCHIWHDIVESSKNHHHLFLSYSCPSLLLKSLHKIQHLVTPGHPPSKRSFILYVHLAAQILRGTQWSKDFLAFFKCCLLICMWSLFHNSMVNASAVASYHSPAWVCTHCYFLPPLSFHVPRPVMLR